MDLPLLAEGWVGRIEHDKAETTIVSNPTYIVGIDLGTTHSVVAYTRAADLEELPPGESPQIDLFAINQVVSPGEVQARPLLPSFLLLPGPHDVPEGALALPWNGEIWAVGEYARERGPNCPSGWSLPPSPGSARPASTVRSRSCPLRPQRMHSASRRWKRARHLEQIRNAWNYQLAQEDETQRLEEQEIYLTVPASFDAVARIDRAGGTAGRTLQPDLA
ncbi:MAG: hypothetical protein R2867_24270 [Caldilineaceae bacterium]